MKKQITQLTGADAERHANNILFAAKNGLYVGEYTQFGLNENSGNVWLWDEDWPACIYQGLSDQNSQFMWSCPNCGHEIDCETLQECYELNDKSSEFKNGGCEQCQESETL